MRLRTFTIHKDTSTEFNKDIMLCNKVAMDKAVKNLSHAGLIMFLYLNSNNNEDNVKISVQEAIDKFGISAKQFQRGLNELSTKKYIERQTESDNSCYNFFEDPELRNEYMLRHIVRKIYPNAKIYSNAKPDWSFGFPLTMYVPEHHVAFDFNILKQPSFEEQRDNIVKSKLCADNGTTLIILNRQMQYDTQIIKQLIQGGNN